MSDFYKDARSFVHKLYDEENMPAIEIAKFCNISWQVVTAILNEPDFDMGTTNYRKILRKQIEYIHHKKRIEDIQLIQSLSEGNGYKEGRKFEGGHKKNRLSEMKRL